MEVYVLNNEIIMEQVRSLPAAKKVSPAWPSDVVTSFTESDTGGNSREYLRHRLNMNFEDFVKSVAAPNA